MNINSFRKGDLKISPTAKYMVNGKSLTSKEFETYIKGLEEETSGEPEQPTDAESTETEETDRPKRRSRTNKVRDSETTTEQTTGNV